MYIMRNAMVTGQYAHYAQLTGQCAPQAREMVTAHRINVSETNQLTSLVRSSAAAQPNGVIGYPRVFKLPFLARSTAGPASHRC